MSTVLQWPFILALLLIATSCRVVDAKVFERCELAKTLTQRHRLDLQEVAQWVCIAQHSSGFNTAAQAFSPSGGSHGIFQISDVYWCSPPGKGAGCNLPCHKLRDDNLSDDLSCAKRIYDEHQRISGDGFTAWNAYQQFCRNSALAYIEDCFPSQTRISPSYAAPAKGYQPHYSGNAIHDYSPKKRGKVYERCELARDLYHKHKMPMEQIPTWVCIAEHESRFDTAAVGRLNADGSADHGLFQISDLYWCSHDRYSGGKACGLSCSKLLDDDITDDVRCIKRIHNEHTAISGDGFNAWTVYRPYCQNQRYEQIANCFKNTQQHKGSTNKHSIANSNNPFFKNVAQQTPQKTHYTTSSTSTYNNIYKTSSNTNIKSTSSRVSSHKGKVYTRCSLAQELFFKHNFPMQDISTWVCIAEHESQFNTAAIGRLNTDGSADHGLFQISDKYWCTHDAYGGKACNLPCDKLLDDDLRDDVQCIRTIHEEHTRISGDGFNAWTVYRPHCQNQNIDHIKSCFDDKTLDSNEVVKQKPSHDVVNSKGKVGKVYSKCELAQELYHKHHMPMEQIPKWVCIAKHESSFNTAAVGRLNTDGSADHGLFQISDLYWCAHDRFGGKACNIPCDKLLDSDITDDVKCIQNIYEEHTRISGDGFNAWTVYKPHCRSVEINHVKDCFTEQELKQAAKILPTSNSNSLIPQSSSDTKSSAKGKIYKKCELAQELFHKHRMPMEQIPKWVCIAQHESSYNTAAVGRLNTDGSADHGLFQISDLYWCTHDQYGGKACNIPCDKLLNSDITDDVKCIKSIYEEHTRISGDGFNAWTVYKPHCRNIGINHVKDCFTEQELKDYNEISSAVISNSIQPYYTTATKNVQKGKIYNKCELAQELLSKHKMPMEQIPTWVCIAQHESSFNTAAVGRLNTDGSLDHGLFQISDLYWCSHDQFGGKACNIPCDKLLDSDITDDIRCIQTIYEEHSRISGDGFNAWTVYKPHCRNRKMEEIRSCLTSNQIEEYDQKQTFSYKTSNYQQVPQAPSKSSYSNNPLLSGVKTQKAQSGQKQTVKQDFQLVSTNQKLNYANNPFLQNIKTPLSSEVHKTTAKVTNNLNAAVVKQDYKQNPFLNGSLKPLATTTLQNYQEKDNQSKITYNKNPFLNGAISSTANSKIVLKPTKDISNEPYKANPFLSVVKPTQSSLQFNTLSKETTSVKKYENKYINSNDFRSTTTTSTLKPRTTATITTTTARTTTRKPTTTWNTYTLTTKKPITTTTRKTTVATTKSATTSTKTTSWTTTKKPTITKSKTTATTTTRKTTKPTIAAWNAYTTTTKTPSSTTARKATSTTTLRSTTTKKPLTTTTTKKQLTTIKTTIKKPFTNTAATTKVPKITTISNTKTTTTKPPRTSTTAKWSYQGQSYTNNATTIAQAVTNLNAYKLTTTTSKPKRTTWSWRQDQNLKTTTKPTVIQKPTTWNWKNEQNSKTTTTQKTTTIKPTTRTTANWQKYDKITITKPSSTTTTPKPTTKTTTRKPSSTTTTFKPTTKTTSRKPTSNTTTPKPITRTTTRKPTSTTTTPKPTTKTTTRKPSSTTTTFKPTTKTTTRKPIINTTTTKSTFNWWSNTAKINAAKTTKSSTLFSTKKPVTTFKPYTYTTTTTKPTKTTTTKPFITTTLKPLTTNSQFLNDYEKYKKDPFSHPFFANVNKQIEQLKSNTTTIKQPTFTATKLQSLPQSALYQDYKNSLSNKTKPILAYNFEASKPTTTKQPRL